MPTGLLGRAREETLFLSFGSELLESRADERVKKKKSTVITQPPRVASFRHRGPPINTVSTGSGQRERTRRVE